MRLRSNLLSIVLATAVPLVVFAVLVATLLVQREQQNFIRAIQDRNRAFLSAVDALVAGEIRTLEIVARSRRLAAGDLASFHADLVAAVAIQPNWLSMILSAPDGRQLLNTSLRWGLPLPPPTDPETVQLAATRRKPVIGNVRPGRVRGLPGIPIRVPVFRGDDLVYVLSVVLKPDAFQKLIVEQRLPPEWITALVDADGGIIARQPERPPGSAASRAFLETIAKSREGWARLPSAEGRDMYTAYLRSDVTQWTVSIGLPPEIVTDAPTRVRIVMAAGGLGSLALGFLAAMWLARRISRPIGRLTSLLPDLGRQVTTVAPPATEIDELRDLGEALVRASEAIRDREEAARREHDAMRAADQAKDEFLAMLSHELRNPLAALTASAAVLRVATPGSDAAAASQSIIERQARHMTRLIEDLLDVSRIAMGKAVLRPEVFELGDVVHRLVQAWQQAGRLRQHVIGERCGEAWVRADRSRIEQIVSNLLDNAVKFTPPGLRITLEVRARDGRAEIVCADEGAGISPELIDRIFDRFVQGPQDISRSQGGLGLGLTLVKRLAEMHGGSVRAESPGVNRGTTFIVALPVAAPPTPEARGLSSATPRPEQRRRVLLVEDNDDVRESTRAVIELLGYDVVAVASGTAALEAAGAAMPDVALVDLGLPDIDGFAVARRLRSLAGSRPLQLIALTGYAQPGDRERALAAGFDDQITKPATGDELAVKLGAHSASN